MIAYYDLARCPPTYDVVAFLARAEIERLARREERIDLRVLPGPVGGFRNDGQLWPRTIEERVAIREKVLLPLCHLLPSVERVALLPDRRDANPSDFGVGQYCISLPAILAALRAGCRPLRPRQAAPASPGLITFTLREAGHHPLRNSRTEEWVAAAKTLRAAGRRVVVVRDAARAYDKIDGVPTAPSASLDVAHRAQLYAQASLNVGICNGPMWMAIFMGVPVLMLRPVTDSARGGYDGTFYAKCGLPPGAQLPTSPAHQRLVWEDDSRDNIVRAVEEVF